MAPKQLRNITWLTLLALFCIFVVSWERKELAHNQKAISQTATILAPSLWDFDNRGPVDYLKIACELNKYHKITVYSLPQKPFLEIQGCVPSLTDRILSALKLLPRMNLQADIRYNDILIGRVSAIHCHDTIYTHLYVLITLGFIALAAQYFFSTIEAKQTLEIRVDERTRELKNEHEKLAVTLRSIGDGVITTDINGTITMLNNVAEELTGWSNDDAQGKPIEDIFRIINEQTGESCENPVSKVMDTGQIIGLANHTALIARDKSKRAIADSGAPIRDLHGTIIGVVLVFRDVTAKQKMEQQEHKFRKLESIGVLAGGIAHDFNNILAAILGNIDLALHHTKAGESTYPLLAEAKKASLRAKDLTQQLLTFSKGGEPVLKTASIVDIISDSSSFILRGSDVRCKTTFAPDLWPVDIDPGQISQVIQNLILNASHAMPQGGVIEIHCENKDVTDQASTDSTVERAIMVSIQDQGIGIPDTIIDQIFDPYFTTKATGSGLGLAICHSIITQHGGHIEVTSQPEKGTCFTLSLHASNKPQSSVAPQPEKSSQHGHGTILVMDDDPMIQDITKAMLTRNEFTVECAENGEEAIEIYSKAMADGHPADLIIMDLTIPGGMGGKEAIVEILKINPKANIIVSSGYSNDPIMANYGDYGFCAALVKPYQLKELIATVQRFI